MERTTMHLEKDEKVASKWLKEAQKGYMRIALLILLSKKSYHGYEMMKEHTVSHGTSIVLNAMNFDDITDLRAEAELWIGGEKHIITKNFGAYVPPNVKCGPLIVRNIEQQMFFMISYPVGLGVTKWRGGK